MKTMIHEVAQPQLRYEVRRCLTFEQGDGNLSLASIPVQRLNY